MLGSNFNGQLGDGTSIDRLTPTQVAGELAFTSIALGAFDTCGPSAGAAYCWGYNGDGQLGDGTIANRLTPTLVSGELTFTSVVPGWFHSCGVTSGGTAYCWGRNDFGQVGDGTTTNRLTPAQVAGGLTFTSTAAMGASYSCGLTSGVTAYCWGYNLGGQLGDGTTTNRVTPTLVLYQSSAELLGLTREPRPLSRQTPRRLLPLQLPTPPPISR